jgi:shikimate kinase
LDSRGVVMEPGKTIDLLYKERLPLYKKYAHLTVDCAGKTHEGIVGEIINRLKFFPSNPTPQTNRRRR